MDPAPWRRLGPRGGMRRSVIYPLDVTWPNAIRITSAALLLAEAVGLCYVVVAWSIQLSHAPQVVVPECTHAGSVGAAVCGFVEASRGVAFGLDATASLLAAAALPILAWRLLKRS